MNHRLHLLLVAALSAACTGDREPTDTDSGKPRDVSTSPTAGRGSTEPVPEAGRGGHEPDAGSGEPAGRSEAGRGPEPRQDRDADGGGPDCSGSIDSLAVSGADAAGYPPYAASACALVYVSSDGALRLRELDTGHEIVIAEASERPARPSLAGARAQLIAWESGAEQLVRVRYSGVTMSVRGEFARGGQARVTDDAVVFSAWLGAETTSDADIWLYQPASEQLTRIAGGPGQQLFPDVSATHVAFSDFSEDPDQRFDDDGRDLANVVLVERGSGAMRTLDRPGKQAFPLLADEGHVVYLQWALSHPEPKLSAYAIMDWDSLADRQANLIDIETMPPYVRPSVYGRTIEWVERPFSAPERLMRIQARAGAQPTEAFSLLGVQLYATASGPNAPLLATREPARPAVMLRSIAR
jgi:hypothetical protein